MSFNHKAPEGARRNPRYWHGWAGSGDVNAFFGLMLDNVAVLIILFSSITAPGAAAPEKGGTIRFTQEFVLGRMIPGTALGVLLGDLVYTVLAFRLQRRTGHQDVTAMPLGLDTPSTFGVAFLVLLPALKEGSAVGMDHSRAMEFAWHVGLMVLVLVGLCKTACAPFGNLVRRVVPRAGLLGSLAAIALTLIAFVPLLLEGIAAMPLVGLASLAVILWSLVAHRELPGRFPGALAAVLLGVVLYQAALHLGQAAGWPLVPAPRPVGASGVWQPAGLASLYGAPSDWWLRVFWSALGKLPVMLPFALATVVGGIDCTESAAAAGDEYDTRAILLTEALTSLAAGLLGGVIQSTPYIGHPAYKKMGGRAGYTLATALFVGAVGCLGGFTLLFDWLPQAALFPILVFVGLEITSQSFQATPPRHYPALALAVLPALAYLITIPLKSVLGERDPLPDGVVVMQTLRCLANGFLVTSLLWGAALATLLDGQPVRSAASFALAGVCALVGVIHSPLADERIGLPWEVLRQVPEAFQEAVRYQTPYHWAGAYGVVALLLVGLGFVSRESAGESQSPEGGRS